MKIDDSAPGPTSSEVSRAADSPGSTTNAGKLPSKSLTPATLPAFAIVDSEDACSTIAGLRVLDRLVVTLFRAGTSQIVIVGKNAVDLPRAREMGIPFLFVPKLPEMSGPVLATSANVLVSPADVREVLQQRGCLVSPAGDRFPLAVIERLTPSWRNELTVRPGVPVRSFAAVVTRDTAEQVEPAYWKSITSSSDGFVDRYVNRPIGRLLSRRLITTRVTPNQLSIFATLVGLLSGGLFALGTAGSAVAGALVLQLSAILDCIDGDIARVLFKESPLGKWLDIIGDQVVHIAVFLGLGIGLWRSGSTTPVLLLGSVAALGVVLSFLVVLRALTRPELRGQSRLQRLIDATTNRDFSVLLILFSVAGVLEWFLWLAAAGSHVFWVVAATLQVIESRNGCKHAQVH